MNGDRIMEKIKLIQSTSPDKLVSTGDAARSALEIKRILIEAWREVRIVEAQEATRRELIRALKEATLKKIETFENLADELLKAKIEALKKAVEKELEVIDRALDSGNLEMLKVGLSSIVQTLDSGLIDKDIEKLAHILRGKFDDDIEL